MSVIKLGGSILFKGDKLNRDVLSGWIEIIASMLSKSKVAVVVGGGTVARMYIRWARDLGLSEFVCDLFGIGISRLNAMLISNWARYRYPEINISTRIPSTPQEVLDLINVHDLVFCGGLIPGQSTVGVASEVAEAIGAKYLLIATDVDGIYDKDPKIYSDAKRIARIGLSELLEKFKFSSQQAGSYKLFDIQSLKIMERAKITCIVFNGSDLSKSRKIVELVLENKLEHIGDIGTIVVPSQDVLTRLY